MAPIPVHIEAPISPTAARYPESQAQTQFQPSTNSTNLPAYNPATTTAAPSAPQSYQPARPGAAVPAPTTPASRPIPPPTRTQPDQFQSDSPPAPRPGDAPSLANTTAYGSNSTSVPPPPKAGSTSAQPFAAVPPPQAQFSPPENNYAPTHSTDSSTPARSGPTTVNLGPVLTPSAQHPPGYVQNAYAQELNPAQRASLEVQEERERQAEGGFAAGLLGGHSRGESLSTGGQGAGESMGEAWETVKTISADAGKRISQSYSELHEAAWKMIKKGV